MPSRAPALATRAAAWPVLALLAALLPATTGASPVRWTITPTLILSGGGRLTGGFTFDADTGLYSSVSLVSTNTTGAVPAVVYRFSVPGQNQDPSRAAFFWASTEGGLLGQREIYLPYFGRLTNAGGAVDIGQAIEGHCVEMSPLTGNICLISQERIGFLTSRLVGVPVPVPAAAWLFGSAAGVLGLMRRPRARRTPTAPAAARAIP